MGDMRFYQTAATVLPVVALAVVSRYPSIEELWRADSGFLIWAVLAEGSTFFVAVIAGEVSALHALFTNKTGSPTSSTWASS